MNGGSGDDKFVAGDAQENVIGGAGHDTLTYEASTAGVTANLATGAAQSGYAQGDRIRGVEHLTGSAYGDDLTGNSSSNIILGWTGNDRLSGANGDDQIYGNEGDDSLFGGGGNDELHGGEGADLLDGGNGIDTASWARFQLHPKGGPNSIIPGNTGVVADIRAGTAGPDTLVNIENLTGGPGNDKLFGNAKANVLSGAGGSDYLRGRGGNDALLGGDGDDNLNGQGGDDWLNGGSGINTIKGGAGRDILDYTYLTRGITVEMPGAGSRTGLDAGLVHSEVEIDKPIWADTGTEEAREVVPGVNVTPERLFKLNVAFAETPEDLNPVPYLPDVLPPELQVGFSTEVLAGLDSFAQIEVIMGGSGDDSFLGNAQSNEFHGNSGKDSINGGGGGDSLDGQGGNDKIAGNGGNDTLDGGLGKDTLNGQIGSDKLSGGGGDDKLVGLAGNDMLIGQGGKDKLFGGANDDTLNGGGGSDNLQGAVGNDKLLGGGGDDAMSGGSGNDTMNGGSGSDKLLGGKGSDVLNGSGGNDSLTGGGGADRFVFVGAFGDDTIFGFAGGNAEKIDLSGVRAITGFGDLLAHHLVDAGNGDAMIVAGTKSILLDGITVAEIGDNLAYSAGDFIFM